MFHVEIPQTTIMKRLTVISQSTLAHSPSIKMNIRPHLGGVYGNGVVFDRALADLNIFPRFELECNEFLIDPRRETVHITEDEVYRKVINRAGASVSKKEFDVIGELAGFNLPDIIYRTDDLGAALGEKGRGREWNG